jgi:glutamyl-tRNA synthetase
LRFEDTDRARSTRESERDILEALAWLGLDWDPVPGWDGIPRQSERTGRYTRAVADLLERGHAYRCTCTPEAVEAMRERARRDGRKPGYDGTCRERGIGPDAAAPFCVRLRVPSDGLTRWPDLIAGPSGEDAKELDDFVIARSDGTPIYHMAVVVDDHEMGITHVLRGREHMSSTPRQLLLYQGLGWEAPLFGHVPLLVEEGGKKLSKRHEAASVLNYRERGYLPEAVLNFIARLGWGQGDLEIFERDEFARLFTLEGVGRSPSQVRDDKLLWLNQHYLKAMSMERLRACAQPFLDAVAGRPVSIDAGLERLLDLLRERSRTLEEMATLARFYLAGDVEPDAQALGKHFTPEVTAALEVLVEALGALAQWSDAALHDAFHAATAESGLPLGKLAQPVRLAITGTTSSPGIFETLALLGRERSLSRLRSALGRVRGAGSPGAGGF